MASGMRLVTWNLNSVRRRVEAVRDWVDANRPHVILLQETKVIDDDFPLALFDNLGYDIAIHGQKAYNGVAVASRVGLTDISRGLPGLDDSQARVIEATVQGVRVMSVYAPNGGGRQEKYDHKMEFYGRLRERLCDLGNEHEMVVAGGDYNVAPSDDDVYDIEDYGHDGIGVRVEERDAYRRLLDDTGFADAHALLDGPAHDHTWWDYRESSFRKDRGLRIDHFLIRGCGCQALQVDREPRRGEQPSDHAPVILETDVQVTGI